MGIGLHFTGSAIRLGSNIDTDAILPGRYLNLTDPALVATHCLEDYDPDFRNRITVHRIVVADENFGCGSSREHAPVAIKGCGAHCVIARSFSRLFFRNAINIGLPVIELEQVEDIRDGDTLDVDMTGGVVRNVTTGGRYAASPLPPFIQELLIGGGAIPYIEGRLAARDQARRG
jgi:3-isopropylmalate/(R)-2-methylmalate dehydratase small subunit